MPKISEPRLKGLQATARGEVIRTYTGSVYTITGPVGSKALWELMRDGLIADGPKIPGQSKTPMVLTASGQRLLSTWEKACKSSFQSAELKPVRPPRLAAYFGQIPRPNSRKPAGKSGSCGRLGTLPSAEDVPSLAELARWSSPQPAEPIMATMWLGRI